MCAACAFGKPDAILIDHILGIFHEIIINRETASAQMALNQVLQGDPSQQTAPLARFAITMYLFG